MSVKEGRCYHLRDKGVEGLCRSIREKQYALICINDTDQTTEFEKKKMEIKQAFQETLPNKSSFEI